MQSVGCADHREAPFDGAHSGQSLSGTLCAALPCKPAILPVCHAGLSLSSTLRADYRAPVRRERTGTCEARPEGQISRMRRVNRPRHATLSRFARESWAARPWPARSSRCISPCRFVTSLSPSYTDCHWKIRKHTRHDSTNRRNNTYFADSRCFAFAPILLERFTRSFEFGTAFNPWFIISRATSDCPDLTNISARVA